MEKLGERSINDTLLLAYRYNRANAVGFPGVLAALSVLMFFVAASNATPPRNLSAHTFLLGLGTYAILFAMWCYSSYQEKKLLEEYNARTKF